MCDFKIERVFAEGPVVDAFEGIREEASCLVFSSDGSFLIAGFSGGWIQAWQWPEMNVRIKIRSPVVYSDV